MNEVEAEARELEDILDWHVDQLRPTVAEFRSTHTDAETVIGLKADLRALAWIRMAAGSADVLGDYHVFGLSLLRLLDARARIRELEDAVAMRDSVIRSLGELEEL